MGIGHEWSINPDECSKVVVGWLSLCYEFFTKCKLSRYLKVPIANFLRKSGNVHN